MIKSKHTSNQFNIMVVQTKLFQSFKRYNRVLGIHPTQSNQSYSFNLKSAIILSLYTSVFISTGSYLLFKAQTIPEFAQSFCLSVTCFFIFMDFMAMSLGNRDILLLIEKMEEFIQKSRFMCYKLV